MDSEKSEYELLREKNLKEQEALFESMFKEVEQFNEEFVQEFEETVKKKTPPKVKKRKTPKEDRAMRFRVEKPTEKRKSTRIEGKKPIYNFNDIEEIYETTTTIRKLNKVTDLYSEFSFQKKILKVPSYKYQTTNINYENEDAPPLVRKPDEISDEEIAKILDKIANKICSNDGTFCHQCKLKSLDTKTICRSGFCVSVRGQFCGPCLKNRYNESVAIALKDPNWKCPPCRQNCVCSSCRNNQNDTTVNGIKKITESVDNDSNCSNLQEKILKPQEASIESMFKEDEEELNEKSITEFKGPIEKKITQKAKRNIPKRDSTIDTTTERRKSIRNADKKPKYNCNGTENLNRKRETSYDDSNDSDIFTEYQNNLKTYTNLRKQNNYEEILDEDDENLLGYNKKTLTNNSRLKQSKITTAFYKQRKTS